VEEAAGYILHPRGHLPVTKFEVEPLSQSGHLNGLGRHHETPVGAAAVHDGIGYAPTVLPVRWSMVTASPSHTLYCFPWILTTTKTEGAGFAAARWGAASDMPLLPNTASAGLNIRDEMRDAGEGVDAEVPHAPSQDPRAAGARGAAAIAWRDERARVVHAAREADFPKLIAPPKDLL
jgi:hypothetical protein